MRSGLCVEVNIAGPRVVVSVGARPQGAGQDENNESPRVPWFERGEVLVDMRVVVHYARVSSFVKLCEVGTNLLFYLIVKRPCQFFLSGLTD